MNASEMEAYLLVKRYLEMTHRSIQPNTPLSCFVKMSFSRYLSLPLILLVFTSCDSEMHAKKGKEKRQLEGEWNAVWELDGLSTEMGSMQMTGKWKFSEDVVELQAYGFEGCAFGTDSISNMMNFSISNQTILLNNIDGDLSLEYNLLQASPNHMELGFLDDIKITLTKME